MVMGMDKVCPTRVIRWDSVRVSIKEQDEGGYGQLWVNKEYSMSSRFRNNPFHSPTCSSGQVESQWLYHPLVLSVIYVGHACGSLWYTALEKC